MTEDNNNEIPDVEAILDELRRDIREEHGSAAAESSFGIQENTALNLDFADEASGIGLAGPKGIKGLVRRFMMPVIAHPVAVIVRFHQAFVSSMREYIKSSRKFSARIDVKFAKFEAMDIDKRMSRLEDEFKVNGK